MLPIDIAKVTVPPLKTQGIKTKLVPFILRSSKWDGRGRWIEPFMGSGVVLFNSQAERVLGADSNKHIIALYNAIQAGTLSTQSVRLFLEKEGRILRDVGESHFYAVRERFNQQGDPHDFLFLNRSCFNGIMRFNKKGRFNVPFCRKPERFGRMLVTKICNQVGRITAIMRSRPNGFEFVVQDWRETLSSARPADFVYLDPPYIGRHADYFNQWSETEAAALADRVKQLPCGFAVSMWLENTHRRNEHFDAAWSELPYRTASHFYHVGSHESLRNEMAEALIFKPGYMVEEDVHGTLPVDEPDDDDSPLDLFDSSTLACETPHV
jgi:DNA adenine methylase